MMADLPRIAVGSVQRAADDTAIKWALLDCFESVGLRVQCFLSRAHAAKRDGATAITGLPPRHLDSWLMGPRTCRDLLLRGSRTSELAVVEGTFAAEPCGAVAGVGGRLETLCEWLELPALAIVDARQLSPCQLPERPRQLDGILLDGVCDATHACRLQTTFEALWQVPVVGWLTEVSALRKQIDAIPAGGRPDVSLCRALGQQLALHLKLDRILQIARQHTLCDSAQAGCAGGSCWCSDASRPLQVAVACDDAFGGCFPDTLDLLEARGARLSEFSPLRDDRLPHGADVVYIGCGHPEQFAAQLASNDCMHLALKSHLCSGGRLYAECGGLAYLCQQLETADGQRWSMVGVLRATACYQ
jgi:cobyrinic acid a,c-diamide synthase